MKESDLMTQILEYLTASNVLHFRMNTQGVKHTLGGRTFFKKNPNKGMADILVAIQGLAIWIEAKTAIGKQSPEQKEFQKKVESNGCKYILARDLDSVKTIVENK